ncbi:uncharacterized protein LOC110861942 isoform X1 [Folsomia candida]|nr:uncharacterized protein LOC110861942 isoform X1 [Folsomia candida]XP_021966768.1 uncharacterized protein LOC110861942 isoform X1 [Folsomia candida]XP_035700993.1 uncharacterized protein LOC110861942 isoform X1 [Folsomia candida]
MITAANEGNKSDQLVVRGGEPFRGWRLSPRGSPVRQDLLVLLSPLVQGIQFFNPSRGQILAKFYSMLKPGGYTCLVYVIEATLLLHQEIGKMPKWTGYMKEIRDHLPEWIEYSQDAQKELEESCKEIGYEKVESFVHKSNANLTLEAFTDVVMSLNPFLSQIPSSLYPELKADYAKLILAKGDVVLNGDQEFQFNRDVLFAVFRKPGNENCSVKK